MAKAARKNAPPTDTRPGREPVDEQDQQDFDEAVEAAQQQAADAAAKWRGE